MWRDGIWDEAFDEPGAEKHCADISYCAEVDEAK